MLGIDLLVLRGMADEIGMCDLSGQRSLVDLPIDCASSVRIEGKVLNHGLCKAWFRAESELGVG